MSSDLTRMLLAAKLIVTTCKGERFITTVSSETERVELPTYRSRPLSTDYRLDLKVESTREVLWSTALLTSSLLSLLPLLRDVSLVLRSSEDDTFKGRDILICTEAYNDRSD